MAVTSSASKLIEANDWASLQHAYGPAEDTPAALVDLLNGAADARAMALGHLNHAVHHQNSLYTATAPSALYVAAILSDPRTDSLIRGGEGQWYPLRQALLDWLGSVAGEAGNEVEATLLRLGFLPEEYPALSEVRAIRPTLFEAASTFLHDSDPTIREAALAAVVPLLDAPELTHHRAVLAPMVRGILAASSNRAYRAIAIHGLDAWGEDVSSLIPPAEATAYGHGPWPAANFSSEPPF
ncbi:hypothetical protein [Planotetraspora kaengkrachanensis]|uniref:HEAT repeat domain-containing protein n=1 Tax=Planotetraspora kaengkrachanensis TaxID=575193 RepID=A0A8J3PW55_9ACTN|nr:hypothetical protein [Planotetraspora kaengkrachanensis]GIG82163.1 hypothetical protein Pka01_52900 [Planotetraspora kaengkrachanensis]